MPADKTTVQQLVRKAAKDAEENIQLLRLVGSKPGLWDGLEADKVLGLLRAELQQEATGDSGQPVDTSFNFLDAALAARADKPKSFMELPSSLGPLPQPLPMMCRTCIARSTQLAPALVNVWHRLQYQPQSWGGTSWTLCDNQ